MKRCFPRTVWHLPLLLGALSCGIAEDDTSGSETGGSGGSVPTGGVVSTGGGNAGGHASGGAGHGGSECSDWESWDAALQLAVIDATGVDSPDEDDWSRLTFVEIQEAGSTIGWGCLGGLEAIRIVDSTVGDISVLGTLPQLSKVLLEDSSFDLGLWERASAIRELTVAGGGPLDGSALSAFKSLEKLTLSGQQSFDLSALQGMSELAEVRLMGIPISDLSPLSQLPELRSLTLTGSDVTDLKPLLDASSTLTFVGVADCPLDSNSKEQHIPTLLERGVCVEWTDDQDVLRQEPASCFSSK